MVSLRAYNREIEQLIDNGRYDEAIAHCKHILLSYPKYIEAYRNLGKTLLEAKRYPEARDIFSRVISVYPDDFIAHVGLSIIAEDDRDLDLAIWHMERAFDMQPSNVAIQEELKRLFARRDGAAPQKIRLSRGALVRMYARGELFSQAITEINNIQLEDPKRLELDVLLAKMKFRSGAHEETIAICNQIFEKNPYCFEANQIMLELFLSLKEHERAILHKNRLVSLDPYYRFITNSQSTAEVPEGKIEIERMLYIPETQDATVPTWIQTENTNINSVQDHNLDWLKGLEDQATPPATQAVTFVEESDLSYSELPLQDIPAETISSEIDQVPDWMKNAGWETVPADLQSDDSENTGTRHKEDSNTVETPDWLIPNNSPIADIISNTSQIIENPAFLGDSPDFENTRLESTSNNPFFETKEEANMDTNENLGNEQSNPDNSSDWLRQFSATPDEPSSHDDQDLPDWLKNFDKDEKAPTDSGDEMPDWLKNLHEPGEPTPQPVESVVNPSQDVAEEEDAIEQSDANLNETLPSEFLADPLPNEDLFKEVTPPSQADGWEKIEISEPTTDFSTGEDKQAQVEEVNDDVIPDWVKSVLNSTPQTASVSQEESIPTPTDADSIETILEKPVRPESVTPLNSNGEVEGISQQTNDELLEWLRGLKAEDEKTDIKDVVLENDVQIFEENTADSLDRLEEITAPVTIPLEDFTTEIREEEFQRVEPMATDESTFNGVETPTTEAMQKPLSAIEDGISSLIQDEESPISELTISQQLPNQAIPDSDEHQLIQELLKDKPYEEVPAMINSLVKSGNEFAELLSSFQIVHSQDTDDFKYWQCLGDIYAKRDLLSDALASYQKAEEILVKKISN